MPWTQISRHAAVAVIAAEDQKFLVHGGFDFASIEKAVTDAQSGRRLRGASTISQQVAKNLFLWSGQSWIRKGLEVWFTVWIELLWPKERILEVYLNSAQFGRGDLGRPGGEPPVLQEGRCTPQHQEAALLAAVLPSPTRYRVVNPGRLHARTPGLDRRPDAAPDPRRRAATLDVRGLSPLFALEQR